MRSWPECTAESSHMEERTRQLVNKEDVVVGDRVAAPLDSSGVAGRACLNRHADEADQGGRIPRSTNPSADLSCGRTAHRRSRPWFGRGLVK